MNPSKVEAVTGGTVPEGPQKAAGDRRPPATASLCDPVGSHKDDSD